MISKELLIKQYFLALNGRRGPVWIYIPVDIQSAYINEDNLAPYNSTEDTIKFDFEDLSKKLDNLIKI